MSDPTKQTPNLATAIKELRRHLLEKGNRFERGSHYKGQTKTLSGVAQTVKLYEGMGYQKFLEVGNPPVYAMLARGHREMHIFQPQDPKIRAWLEDEKVALNDPPVRAYLLQTAGLSESDLPTASKPQHFHLSEVDDVFILTSGDTD
ncbi:MAG: hypothetical protein H6974_04550 [Gammaproteobacteria bacterium]|nr:hypothetical protein [Gammaproteobacteria bacterium]MCP5196051.1 hypothetical protein [Gammaproteobacteria bacterium]